jgi:hypothetical protein
LIERRQQHMFLTKPEQRVAHTTSGDELLEHEGDGLLHPVIRVLLDPAVAGLHLADRESENEGTTARLGEQGFVSPLPDPAQLGLAQRAFEPEQKPIIQLTVIVDALPGG